LDFGRRLHDHLRGPRVCGDADTGDHAEFAPQAIGDTLSRPSRTRIDLENRAYFGQRRSNSQCQHCKQTADDFDRLRGDSPPFA
jgi:hypothetical protein